LVIGCLPVEESVDVIGFEGASPHSQAANTRAEYNPGQSTGERPLFRLSLGSFVSRDRFAPDLNKESDLSPAQVDSTSHDPDDATTDPAPPPEATSSNARD